MSIIEAVSTAHARFALARALCQGALFSPVDRGHLLKLVYCQAALPPGLAETSTAGHLQLEIDHRKFSQTLGENLQITFRPKRIATALSNLTPGDPLVFPVASHTHLYLPFASSEPFLIGAQTDTIKVLPAEIIESLGGIVVPSPIFGNRVEPFFPIIAAMTRIVFGNRPLTYIGTPAELQRIRQIIEIELWARGIEAMQDQTDHLRGYTGVGASQLALESQYLAIRPGFAKWDRDTTLPLPFEAFARLLPIEDTAAPHFERTGPYRLRVTDGDKEYDLLTAAATPRPAIPLPLKRQCLPSSRLDKQPDNSIFIISAGNGLDPSVCVSFVLNINGFNLLFELPPYTMDCLEQAGIEVSQLDATVISHHHRDHDNTAEGTGPFADHLIMSPAAAELSARRNAATQNISVEAARDQLKTQPIYPGNPVTLLKAHGRQIRIETLEGMHSVTSNMFAVYSSTDGGKTWTKAVVYTGDTLGPAGLQRAVDDGIITPERREAIINFIQGAKMVVVDCGRRIVHPEPEETIQQWLPLAGDAKVTLVHNVPASMIADKTGEALILAHQAAGMLPEPGTIIRF